MSNLTIGRYQLKEEIGRGGMAVVYHGYDPRFKREVAIKVMTLDFMGDTVLRARFEREAQTIAALEHPAIVPVYDFGEEQGRPYLVMRLMNGGTLADQLRKGPLSIAETTKILQRIGAALERAHQKGIIHRDLKPSNIMYDEYGDAFLGDFGIARLTETAVTLTGDSVVGTPAYMSPEQVNGDKELDGRSDIYALGVICFEMLTGQRPFQADTAARLMMKHLLEPIPDIRQFKPDLPPGVTTVIARTMAKTPDERFATASELSATLIQVMQGAAAPPPLPPTLPTPSPDSAAATVVEPAPTPSLAAATEIAPTPHPIVPDTELMAPTPPRPAQPPSRRGRAWLWGGVAAGVLLILLFGGGLLLRSMFSRDEVSNGGAIGLLSDEQTREAAGLPSTHTATPRSTNTPRPTSTPDPRPAAERHMEQFYNYLDQGELELALAEVDAALSLLDDAWYHHERAFALFLLGELQSALAEINIALAAEPEQADHYNLRGMIRRSLGDHAAAVSDHRRAVQLRPEEDYFYHEMASTYREMGDFAAAIAAWETALTLAPTVDYYYVDIAYTYVWMGDPEAALTTIERGLDKFPDHPDLVDLQIEIRLDYLPDAEAALALINQALRVDPDNPYRYGQLGRLYLHRLNEPETALAHFEYALTLEGAPAWIYGHKGIAHKSLGQYEAAAAAFNQMIELEPESGWPYAEIGWLFLDSLQQPVQALAAFEQAIAVEPGFADAYLGHGRALLALDHDPEEIIAAWQSCLEMNPGQYWCYWDLAWLFAELNQVDQALDNFQLFLDYIPTNDCLDCQQEAQTYIRDHSR